MRGRKRKDNAVMTYLEEPVAEALEVAATRADDSVSGYIRSLIVADLRNRGLLTDAMLVRLATA